MKLILALLVLITSCGAGPALNKVNETRAQRHLPPFIEDPKLTDAAMQAAHYRAYYLIEGHTKNDFKFLPPGTHARAAGCAAWEPSFRGDGGRGNGWGACCTYDHYTYAGAGYEIGRDGRRYMHLFVR